MTYRAYTKEQLRNRLVELQKESENLSSQLRGVHDRHRSPEEMYRDNLYNKPINIRLNVVYTEIREVSRLLYAPKSSDEGYHE